MKKRFYIDASIAVVGSSLIAIIASLILFLVDYNIGEANAPTLISFLGYVTDIFNAIAMFIGFGTIIFAFFRFGFYEGVMSCLIFAGAFIPYFIYTSIARFIYTRSEFIAAGMSGDFDALDAALMAVNQSMGSGVINQILPSILIAFIACKVIKSSTREPKKFFSLDNRLQKSMVVACVTLTVVNLLVFLLTGVLPTSINGYIFTVQSEFNAYLLEILIEVLKMLFLYLVVAYVVFMLTYKFYTYRLSSSKSKKAQRGDKKAKADKEEADAEDGDEDSDSAEVESTEGKDSNEDSDTEDKPKKTTTKKAKGTKK